MKLDFGLTEYRVTHVHINIFLMGKSHVCFATMAQRSNKLDHTNIEFFIKTRPSYYRVTKDGHFHN